MKKLTFVLSLVLLGAGGLAQPAAAQNYDRRIDVPPIINAGRDDRTYRGGDWDRRARAEINRLLVEVRQVRLEIGDRRDRNIRARFHRVTVAADRLSALYAQRRIRGWEVRERADAIRADLDDIRRDLRARYRHLR